MAARHDRSSTSLAPESTPVDVLSDVLRAVRLTGALFFPMQARAPWADEVPDASALAGALLPHSRHLVSYHVVTRGSCWASVRGGVPVRLDTGDVLVVPHGDAYVMSSTPRVPSGEGGDEALAFFRRMTGNGITAVLEAGGDGPHCADVVCGFLGCDARPFNPVLDHLPHLVHVRGPGTGDIASRLADMAVAESRAQRPGTQCVLLRLSELLFVEVIRRYLETLPSDEGGWLAGLRDPVVGRALALLHGRPASPWTLGALAREVGVSRSALAARFAMLVGRPPMAYLAHWRMQLASVLLGETDGKLAVIAAEVGYESEAAFSRAFKKVAGISPAAWRRRNIVAATRGLHVIEYGP